jgi:hypothetical protein
MDLYHSRLHEQREAQGAYSGMLAARNFARHLQAISTDSMRELSYADRKALHHLKYFTWVEQQQKSARDLDRLWDPEFWDQTYRQVDEWDRAIVAFNQRVGLDRGA